MIIENGNFVLKSNGLLKIVVIVYYLTKMFALINFVSKQVCELFGGNWILMSWELGYNIILLCITW